MHASLMMNGLAAGQVLETRPARHVIRPSRAETEMAVRTLIRWAGDNPDREGLIDTPARVSRAYEQWAMMRTPPNYCSAHLRKLPGMTKWWCFATFVLCPIASTTWRRSMGGRTSVTCRVTGLWVSQRSLAS